MRIYLPSTMPMLRTAIGRQRVEPLGGIVFAVTDPLRAEYAGADEEELEYLAMADAARASLRLLAAGDETGPWLRVVVAADVDGVRAIPDSDRAAALLDRPVSWKQVAAVHLDSADAADALRAAALVVDAADLGDAEAEFTVGTAEDIDLGWYAPSEIAYLVDSLD